MKVAYITYSGGEEHSSGNGFNEVGDLLPLLKSLGINITAEVWDDPNLNWNDYNVALLKTPWDYHEKYEQFRKWLDMLKAKNVRLLNDFDIVRWNMDKHYLGEMAALGLNTIPTIFLDKGWAGELAALFDELQKTELIIKPVISAGSKNTIILKKESAALQRSNVEAFLQEGDYMVQPLMHEVQEGEWSFIFFNGKYSHTIIKKPKAGDFRVQHAYGGSIMPAQPSQAEIDEANVFVQQFAKNTFYARVDGLKVDGRFMLMELELIEPYLYLAYAEGAVERYCEALQERLQSTF